MHGHVQRVGELNEELKDMFATSTFGAVAVLVREMPKQTVQSPTQYQDCFERIKMPHFMSEVQTQLTAFTIANILGRERSDAPLKTALLGDEETKREVAQHAQNLTRELATFITPEDENAR